MAEQSMTETSEETMKKETEDIKDIKESEENTNESPPTDDQMKKIIETNDLTNFMTGVASRLGKTDEKGLYWQTQLFNNGYSSLSTINEAIKAKKEHKELGLSRLVFEHIRDLIVPTDHQSGAKLEDFDPDMRKILIDVGKEIGVDDSMILKWLISLGRSDYDSLSDLEFAFLNGHSEIDFGVSHAVYNLIRSKVCPTIHSLYTKFESKIVEAMLSLNKKIESSQTIQQTAEWCENVLECIWESGFHNLDQVIVGLRLGKTAQEFKIPDNIYESLLDIYFPENIELCKYDSGIIALVRTVAENIERSDQIINCLEIMKENDFDNIGDLISSFKKGEVAKDVGIPEPFFDTMLFILTPEIAELRELYDPELISIISQVAEKLCQPFLIKEWLETLLKNDFTNSYDLICGFQHGIKQKDLGLSDKVYKELIERLFPQAKDILDYEPDLISAILNVVETLEDKTFEDVTEWLTILKKGGINSLKELCDQLRAGKTPEELKLPADAISILIFQQCPEIKALNEEFDDGLINLCRTVPATKESVSELRLCLSSLQLEKITTIPELRSRLKENVLPPKGIRWDIWITLRDHLLEDEERMAIEDEQTTAIQESWCARELVKCIICVSSEKVLELGISKIYEFLTSGVGTETEWKECVLGNDMAFLNFLAGLWSFSINSKSPSLHRDICRVLYILSTLNPYDIAERLVSRFLFIDRICFKLSEIKEEDILKARCILLLQLLTHINTISIKRHRVKKRKRCRLCMKPALGRDSWEIEGLFVIHHHCSSSLVDLREIFGTHVGSPILTTQEMIQEIVLLLDSDIEMVFKTAIKSLLLLNVLFKDGGLLQVIDEKEKEEVENFLIKPDWAIEREKNKTTLKKERNKEIFDGDQKQAETRTKLETIVQAEEKIDLKKILGESHIISYFIKSSKRETLSNYVVELFNRSDIEIQLAAAFFAEQIFASKNIQQQDFFYSTDVNVLFDVIFIRISDTHQGDPLMYRYLRLLDAMLQWHEYGKRYSTLDSLSQTKRTSGKCLVLICDILENRLVPFMDDAEKDEKFKNKIEKTRREEEEKDRKKKHKMNKMRAAADVGAAHNIQTGLLKAFEKIEK